MKISLTLPTALELERGPTSPRWECDEEWLMRTRYLRGREWLALRLTAGGNAPDRGQLTEELFPWLETHELREHLWKMMQPQSIVLQNGTRRATRTASGSPSTRSR
jgi:hypothetical protein